MHPAEEEKLTSTASRVCLSPHEWQWTQEEIVAICLKLLRQNDKVKDLEHRIMRLQGTSVPEIEHLAQVMAASCYGLTMDRIGCLEAASRIAALMRPTFGWAKLCEALKESERKENERLRSELKAALATIEAYAEQALEDGHE